MSPNQKAARFTLIVIGGTVLIYLAALPLVMWATGKPLAEVAGPTSGLFGLIGFTGMARLFYRAAPEGGPITDERDRLIEAKAWQFGMGVFWATFIVVCVGSWALMYYRWQMEHVTLPVELFPASVGGGMIVFLLAQSLATLHLYGWSRDHEELRQ